MTKVLVQQVIFPMSCANLCSVMAWILLKVFTSNKDSFIVFGDNLVLGIHAYIFFF